MNISGFVPAENGIGLDGHFRFYRGHRNLLLRDVVTLIGVRRVTASRRDRHFTSLIWPIVLGFSELTTQHFHDAVCSSMIMDRTIMFGGKKYWLQRYFTSARTTGRQVTYLALPSFQHRIMRLKWIPLPSSTRFLV
jgi:hypothetical protein